MKGPQHDNLFLLFGVSYTSHLDSVQLQKNYRRLARLCHPDKKGTSADEFIKLKEGLETLLERRLTYVQTAFSTSDVPEKLEARLEEREDGWAVCVSWGAPAHVQYKPRYALLVRAEGFLRWNVCFEGRKEKVVIESLAPGLYELAVMVAGGPPSVISCVVANLEQDRVEKLMSLSGMTEARARKSLHRYGTVEAALDRLMKRGLNGKRKKKKKKKKPESKLETEEIPRNEEETVPKVQENLDLEFFLTNVKCFRCKVFIPLLDVETHECITNSA